MTTPSHLLHPFTLEGHKCVPIGRGCLLRDDAMIGHVKPWRKPDSLDEVYWYTLSQVADRAGVPVATIKARLRDRWGFADLIKPAGFERLVDARRNGVPMPDGTRMPIKDVCASMRVSKFGLEHRILQGWAWADVLQPGRTTRFESIVPPHGAATEPPTYRKPGDPNAPVAVYAHAPFWYRGALDTLRGHCDFHGLVASTVRARLRQGCTVDEAFAPRRKPRADKGKPNPKRGYRRGDIPPPAQAPQP